MSFELTILGCSSATPTRTRHQSSHFININNKYFLVDCGEGTQQQLRNFRIRLQQINHIFISHLHGDHSQGLIGMVSTMHLLGRKEDLHIYGFIEGLKQIIDVQLKYSETILNYKIVYHNLRSDIPEKIYEDDSLTVETIILKHSLPCCGFLFAEKEKPRNIKKEFLEKENIPFEMFNKIKSGEDYINPEGVFYKNEEITYPVHSPRKYAYCSDTMYTESIVPQIYGVDILYHEATFTEDLKSAAKEKFHSTAFEAATIAKTANVKELIIGHYSARYKELDPLLNEARSIFKNTYLAEEGKKYCIS
ncbi:MAG: ribonuclease Z [Bacteroidota bacterium]|nr:ribonuclease Z [Bacteroidota bacterium]